MDIVLFVTSLLMLLSAILSYKGFHLRHKFDQRTDEIQKIKQELKILADTIEKSILPSNNVNRCSKEADAQQNYTIKPSAVKSDILAQSPSSNTHPSTPVSQTSTFNSNSNDQSNFKTQPPQSNLTSPKNNSTPKMTDSVEEFKIEGKYLTLYFLFKCLSHIDDFCYYLSGCNLSVARDICKFSYNNGFSPEKKLEHFELIKKYRHLSENKNEEFIGQMNLLLTLFNENIDQTMFTNFSDIIITQGHEIEVYQYRQKNVGGIQCFIDHTGSLYVTMVKKLPPKIMVISFDFLNEKEGENSYIGFPEIKLTQWLKTRGYFPNIKIKGGLESGFFPMPITLQIRDSKMKFLYLPTAIYVKRVNDNVCKAILRQKDQNYWNIISSFSQEIGVQDVITFELLDHLKRNGFLEFTVFYSNFYSAP
ncbi:hypothetical protein M153_772000580 [Pseudoloma neurophilia]|uniref:Uncharacterized protein n=1 Tax=Pseudoloma neurophilia TaxID=146866 RepID=A0A0R0M3C3_9MICR|nr:hypothetical protein M153_772000580 [Pseudoloma neurophilia]